MPTPVTHTRLLTIRCSADHATLFGSPGTVRPMGPSWIRARRAFGAGNLRELALSRGWSEFGALLGRYGGGTRRLVESVPAATIQRLEALAADSAFPPLHSMTSYWRWNLTETDDDIEEILAGFYDVTGALIKGVEAAWEELPIVATMAVVDPAGDPQTGDNSTNVYWRSPTLGGIGAESAWALTGGAGVQFVLIDAEWYKQEHPDLPGLGLTDPTPAILHGTFNNANTTTDGEDGRHGTAALGIVKAFDHPVVADNPSAGGVVGLAPAATLAGLLGYKTSAGSRVSAAVIVQAITLLQPGDVILLEFARSDGGEQYPTEFDSADLDAIRLATASGLIVVEPAGDSSGTLDNVNRLNRTDAAFVDSGAIVVSGVGSMTAATGHLNHSTRLRRGSRVDCYSWANGVQTVGAAAGSGSNQPEYVEFRDTSAASAIIAGVALLVQSLRKGQVDAGTGATGFVLSPTQMRQLLADRALGLPVDLPPGTQIGTQPKLGDVLTALALRPDIFVRDFVGDTGLPHVQGIFCASPDIMVFPTADVTDALRTSLLTPSTVVTQGTVSLTTNPRIIVRILSRSPGAATNVKANVYYVESSTLRRPYQWVHLGEAPLSFPVTSPFDVGTMPAGSTALAEMSWPAALLPTVSHGCLVAILGSTEDPAPYTPTQLADTTRDWTLDEYLALVCNQNNVAWRNLDFVTLAVAKQGLEFVIGGAPDKRRRFTVELHARLPQGARLLVETPQKHATLFDRVKENPIVTLLDGLAVRHVPDPRGTVLAAGRLSAGAQVRCRLRVDLPAHPHKEVMEIAVRQIWSGVEVGRITWRIRG